MISKNLESEMIALLFAFPNRRKEAALMLRADYFEERELRNYFRAIMSLHGKNVEVTHTLLMEELKKMEVEFDIARLVDVTGNFGYEPDSNTFRYNCILLAERWMRRAFKRLSKKFSAELDKSATDVFDAYSETMAKFEQIVQATANLEAEKAFADKLEAEFQAIREERAGGKPLGITSRRFPSLKHTGGFLPGNLIAISGEYKSGKTTFGLSLAADLARSNDKSLAVFSLEMSESEVIRKLISLETGTRYGYLRNPSEKNHAGDFRYSDEKFFATARKANEIFEPMKINIDDRSVRENEIKNKITLLASQGLADIVLIDYISLIEPAVKRERRDLEVSSISRGLKNLAKELGIIIIVLSQENNDKKIAESKGLARDADFWLRISMPINETTALKEKIVIDGIEYNIEIDNSLFKIKLAASRHSISGWKFYAYFMRNGMFAELDVVHSESEKTTKKEMPF